MKQMRFFAAIFATVVAFSCAKEVAPEVIIDGPAEAGNGLVAMSFTAIADNGITTRTSLGGDDGLEVFWAANEGIYVFDGDAPRAFKSDNTEASSTVTFNGLASSGKSVYYAVYPSGTYSKNSNATIITTSIPVFQTATVGSFAPKANAAIACVDANPNGNNNLYFQNLGAVVKFKVSDDNITKVRLDALGGGKLSGKMNVVYNGDENFTSAMSDTQGETQSCVILNGSFAKNTDYYFVIAPGSFTGGFRITLFKGKSYKSFKNEVNATLQRNEIWDFGTIPEVSTWKSNAVDAITLSTTGVSGTSYKEFTGKSASNGSNAVYAGQCAGGNSAIQLRSNNSNSGIVTTTSGGFVRKITITWIQNDGNDNRTVNIYGKKKTKNGTIITPAVAYSGATDLYGNNAGTSLGTISYNEKNLTQSISINDEDGYEYIGLRSSSGALYLGEVDIEWSDSPTSGAPIDPATVIPSTSISDLSSPTVGLSDNRSATFKVTSNVPWTVAVNKAYASLSVSGNTVTVTFDALSSGSRDATVTVTPDNGSSVSQIITQSGGTQVSLNCANLSGFSNWGTGYVLHTIDYDDYSVKFEAANKQQSGSEIDDIPVTKGSPVELIMGQNKGTISSVSFTCRQWATKAQTITLHYSTNRGSSYTSTNITSTNFTIQDTELPSGTNAVKITFSSLSNQVGIEGINFTYQ